jgi:phage gp29-like protein
MAKKSKRGRVGPDAKAVAVSDLVGEALPPDTSWRSVRSSQYPSMGITPIRLAQIFRQADNGDPRAYLELAEEAEEKSGHYMAVLSTRKRAVMQLPITVTAAGDEEPYQQHAQLVRDWIDTGVLQDAMLDMLDAVSKSFSVLEIDWQTDRDHFWPARLIHRPAPWFAPDAVDGQTIRLREGVTYAPLPEHKFIVHTHRYKSGQLIRGGLGRVALWGWMLKMFTDRDWALFCERYGLPIRVGRYDTSSTDEDRRILWRAVKGIAGDLAAIFPKSMDIEFPEVAQVGQSADLYEKRCKYIDYELSKVVLGQTTTTDAVAGGHAVAQEHRLVQEDIERSDGIAIGTTITRQLVPLIVAYNFGPQDEYPRVNIGRPDELPVKDLSDALAKLLPAGLTVKASEIRGRLGVSNPEPEDEVIGGKTAPAEPPATIGATLQRALNARRRDSEMMVDRLTDRLERDAAGALNGLTDEIRMALMQAESLPDALSRLEALRLDATDLAVAMRRGMALAHLAGQAALMDEIEDER